jgi:photosystem II stability/assembly factor-like uncharacterized protein
MFRSSLFFVLLLASSPSFAAWEKQSVFPADRNLKDAAFLSPTHGFVVGDDRHLLETTDGGLSWVARMSEDFSSDVPFYAIQFTSSTRGYICGNSSDFWRTTNGGATWSNLNTLPVGSWYHLDFLDDSSGFAGANGALMFTSNAGSAWTLRSGWPNCPVIYGMSFRDTMTGLVSGYSVSSAEDGVFKTTNGGTSWSRKLAFPSNDVIWIDASTALAASGTTAYRSTNAGDTWSGTGASIPTGLIDMTLVDGAIVVGVSGKGDVWRSTNAGVSWVQTAVGIGSLPDVWKASFSDSQNGWVVGPGGFVFQTNDAGLTWSIRNRGTNFQIYDLDMFTENYGFAVGWAGYVLRTTNGGDFWETRKLEVTGQIFGRDEHLYGVSIVDDEFAVAAGPGGTVFRTYDAGGTWESIGYPELPDAFWIEDVEFIDRDHGWIVGLDQDLGHAKSVYRTTDGGTTWNLGMNQNTFMFAVDFHDRSTGWIASTGPLYFRTTNEGASWTQGALPSSDMSPMVTDMEFANASVGWAVGWYGYVAKSTNGGVTWQLQSFGSPAPHAFGLDVVSASEAWVTGRDPENGDRSYVARTTNGGSTWSREHIQDFPYYMTEVDAGPGGSVWVAGYAGRVLQQPGTTVSVSLPQSTPGVLMHPVRPNPTASSATISFEIPHSASGLLDVFDVSGRRVARIWEGSAGPGVQQMHWGEDAAPGTYFLKLELVSPLGEKWTESQRLVRIQ